MTRAISVLRQCLPDATDSLVLVGLTLILIGVGLMSKPVSMIAAGLALVALAILQPYLNGGRR